MNIKIVPLIFSLLLGSITTYHAIEQKKLVESAEYTVGVVTDIIVKVYERQQSEYLIIDFVSKNNKSYQFKSNISFSGYSVGDDIGVGYLKDDISSVIVWDYGAIWSRVYLLSFFTIITFFIGLGLSRK